MKRITIGLLGGLFYVAVGCTTNNSDAGKDASADTSTGDGGLVPAPTSVDCSKKENCYHLVCYDDPNCQDVQNPGGCPIGMVAEINQPDGGTADGGIACRACTADDCDGLPGYCCGADVCKHSVECGMFVCANIAATCNGVTSDTCGFHDLDGDDAWGDCDEAPADPCCYCKVAIGCVDSKCTPGNYVKDGTCVTCTASDCIHPPCMGLNGCPTNCPAGNYFDGVRCRDCAVSSSTDFIPACNLDAGAPDAGGETDAGAD
jgi:hypothetical protein